MAERPKPEVLAAASAYQAEPRPNIGDFAHASKLKVHIKPRPAKALDEPYAINGSESDPTREPTMSDPSITLITVEDDTRRTRSMMQIVTSTTAIDDREFDHRTATAI